MNDIQIFKETMSSLEIAEVTGKQHAHVMRDIRNLLSQGVAESNFGLGKYTDANSQERPCYELTKKGCLILASGYDAKLREKIIDRWEELETRGQSRSKMLPKTYLEALKELVAVVEANEMLTLENKAMKPKAEYFDNLVEGNLLTSVSTCKFIEALIAESNEEGLGQNCPKIDNQVVKKSKVKMRNKVGDEANRRRLYCLKST